MSRRRAEHPEAGGNAQGVNRVRRSTPVLSVHQNWNGAASTVMDPPAVLRIVMVCGINMEGINHGEKLRGNAMLSAGDPETRRLPR